MTGQRTILRLLFLSFFGAIFIACDNPVSLNQFQSFSEVSWKSDGSAMIALVQRFNADQYTVFPAESYTLYRIKQDGSLGDPYSTPEKAISDFSFAVFQSQDSKQGTLQLGNNAYRVDLSSGSSVKLATDYHLIAVSPDEKYIIGSHSPAQQPVKTISIYDVSGTTPRLVKGFDYRGVSNSRGSFFANGTFGVTMNDSVGKNIVIFDTLGTALDTIGDASISSHNFTYRLATNSLYFRNGHNNIVKVKLDNPKYRTTVLTSVAENFDITSDERIIVFNKYESGKLQMIKHDVLTGAETLLTEDFIWGVFIAPTEDKVAYIKSSGLYLDEIKVVSFTR